MLDVAIIILSLILAALSFAENLASCLSRNAASSPMVSRSGHPLVPDITDVFDGGGRSGFRPCH